MGAGKGMSLGRIASSEKKKEKQSEEVSSRLGHREKVRICWAGTARVESSWERTERRERSRCKLSWRA